MLNNLTGWHFLIILVVILLLFGAPKLPGLARSLGQSMKIFKNEIKPEKTDEDQAGGDTARITPTSDADQTSAAARSTDSPTKP